MSKLSNNKKNRKNFYRKLIQKKTKKMFNKSKKNKTNKKRKNCNLLNNWEKTVSETYNWQKIVVSGNFKYHTAIVRSKLAPHPDPIGNGNIFLSSDYGNNWIKHPKNFNYNWEGLSMNETGKYQSAIVEGKNIYTSSDYGLNWKLSKVTSNWITICISNEGRYQSVVANGYFPADKGKGFIYTSKNYGNTWEKKSEYNVSWVCLAMSSSGKIQTAGSFLLEDPDKLYKEQNGYVYNSYDYGDTWEKNKSLKQSWWTSVALSGNGKIQIICAINCNLDIVPPGPIYISYDYGKIFNRVICPNEPWLTLAISKSGKYMMAASYKQQDSKNKDIHNTGGMILSENYGKTWKYTNAPRSQYTSIALSDNACHATATAWGDGIYKC